MASIAPINAASAPIEIYTEGTSRNIHKWQAEEYHENSSAQKSAALGLLAKIALKGDEKILDVGCGDGQITAHIAEKVPGGNVLGIDISPNMISFAAQRFDKQNLKFLVKDAQVLDFDNKFDIIFSSFALQWLTDLNRFLGSARESLRERGCLAATIPLGISTALEEAIAQQIVLPKWSPYFENFLPGWKFVHPEYLRSILTQHNFKTEVFEIVEQEVIFPSREAFAKYVHQWFSYLQPIPEESKSSFFQSVMDGYFDQVPANEKGQIPFKFPRVDLIVHKTTP